METESCVTRREKNAGDTWDTEVGTLGTFGTLGTLGTLHGQRELTIMF